MSDQKSTLPSLKSQEWEKNRSKERNSKRISETYLNVQHYKIERVSLCRKTFSQ